MRKLKFDLSTILFVAVELALVADIIVAICKGISLPSYIMTAVLAMMGFLEAELIRRQNKK